jgi:hypothetical protein
VTPEDLTPEHLTVTEKGRAVIESGLSLRQAHEIETGCSPDHLCPECQECV